LFSGRDASATESWLAMNCDYVVKYENDTYGWQHPVAIVSWPTLDPIEHDSEWNAAGLKSLEYNDKVSVDINHIEVSTKMQAGFFGAYHIYPNYPDFMNNESKYDSYSDEEGRFRYGGYLKEFIETHTKYPALVAEFGLATGMGNAHTSPDGYNHGGLTEEQQGQGIVRMMKAIQKEGYAGGLIFEWIDEWAKKTWTTESFMIPYERHVFWHNKIDPEQNYGILAMDPLKPDEEIYSVSGNRKIQKVELKHDAAYLYLDITLDKEPDFTSDKYLVGLDTYDRQRGDFKFSRDIELSAPSGLEFLLDLQGPGNSKILVHPGYNISKGNYSSYPSTQGIFEEIRPLINSSRVTKSGQRIKVAYENGSLLNYGHFTESSINNWYVDGNRIHLRIPWGRLNFSDPSESRVLDDKRKLQNPQRDEIETIITDGILFSLLLIDVQTKLPVDVLCSETPFKWNSWTEVKYEERMKESFSIIQDYFRRLE